MEWFLKAAAGVLVAVILWIILAKQGKEYALILSIGACCLVLLTMLRFLEPVLDLMEQLQTLGDLRTEWLSIMLKGVAIGLIVEIGSLICADAGNGALSKTMQLLGTVAILWLCIPLMNGVITLLQQILGEL